MDAYQYLKLYGKKTAESVCAVVGTSYGYYKQIAYGHRAPSMELAHKLVEATNGEIDVVSLMRAAHQGPVKNRLRYVGDIPEGLDE